MAWWRVGWWRGGSLVASWLVAKFPGGEMTGNHNVRSQCGIGQTYSKFGWTMSGDRLLFPALPFIIKLLLFAVGYKRKPKHNLTKVNGCLNNIWNKLQYLKKEKYFCFFFHHGWSRQRQQTNKKRTGTNKQTKDLKDTGPLICIRTSSIVFRLVVRECRLGETMWAGQLLPKEINNQVKLRSHC